MIVLRLPVLHTILITCHIFFTFLQCQELPGAERFELRDLGVPHVNAIPPDESAVTSLIVGPAGNIYGGTTGPVCHLFVFSPKLNRVKPLGQIDGHQSIHHSLSFGGDGILYIGTGLDEIKQYPISDPVPGHGGIVISLWNDIKQRYNNYDGGHLFRYNPSNNEKTRVEIGQTCKLEDLGIPVPHNGIYNIVASPDGNRLYGLTYPDGHFFIYDIKTEKFFDKGEIYQERVYGGPNRTLRSISRNLICDDNGNVYGSADKERLFMYDIEKDEIVKLELRIPHIYIAVVEVFVKDTSGIIYGGTSEGYLFNFDPKFKKLINLGKPLDQMRIRALTIGLDAKIYGIAGERKDRCHLFAYDPETGGYSDFGIINVDRTPYYVWSGKQFDAMVTGLDGTIYIGESERKSHLFLFYP
jgi:WD40 repeat protein